MLSSQAKPRILLLLMYGVSVGLAGRVNPACQQAVQDVDYAWSFTVPQVCVKQSCSEACNALYQAVCEKCEVGDLLEFDADPTYGATYQGPAHFFLFYHSLYRIIEYDYPSTNPCRMPNCPEKDTCLGMSLAGPQALLNGQCKVDTDECSAECQSMITLPCDTCKAGDTVDYTLGTKWSEANYWRGFQQPFSTATRLPGCNNTCAADSQSRLSGASIGSSPASFAAVSSATAVLVIWML